MVGVGEKSSIKLPVITENIKPLPAKLARTTTLASIYDSKEYLINPTHAPTPTPTHKHKSFTLTIKERDRLKVREEREQKAQSRQQMDATRGMMRELETVINLRPSKRSSTSPAPARVMSM